MGVNSTCILGLLATNIAHFQLSNNDANASENLIQFVKSFDSKCITFSLIAALLNEYYVVPKALTVGAMTMKYRIGKDNDQQNTIMAFAKDGGSAFDDTNVNDSGHIVRTRTDKEKARLGNRMKILHRSVASLVVCSALGVILHVYSTCKNFK